MKRLTTSLIALLLSGAAYANDASLSAMFFSPETTVADVAAAIDAGADIHERSNKGQEPLHYAIQRGASLEVIQYLIDQGADLNQPTGKGLFVTYYAARYGNLELMQLLDKAGADFAKRDYMEEDATHWLAYNDNLSVDMIDYFKAKGLDFNRPNRNAETPAMLTVWDIRQDFGIQHLEMMVDAGSDALGINGQGQDMLMMGLRYGSGPNGVAGLQYLFDQSEDPYAADNSGLSGILLASSYGMTEDTLQFLEANDYDLTLTDTRGANALVRAAGRGNAAAIDLLVGRGFDIHSTDKDGTTPLLNTFAAGKPDATLRLIELGADLSHANAKGETALLLALGRDFAVVSGHGAHGAHTGPTWDDVLAKLMADGADLTMKDADGTTALVYALQGNKPVEIIEQILAAGVDVNQADAIGTTPLMLAAMNGKDATVLELLLAAGADIAATDVFGDTAADLLAENEALAGGDILARLRG